MKPKKKSDCDYMVKAVIIGDSGVGKSNILLRYCDNSFNPSYASTIGVDFKVKTMQIEQYKIKFQIWDTAGQEKFKNISPTYYKGAMIIILVYSIENAASFQNVESWISQIHEFSSPEVSIFLVASKIDMKQTRKVQYQSGQKLAKSYGMSFYEVSAKDGTNINELFEKIGRSCYDKIKGELIDKGPNIPNNNISLIKQDVQSAAEPRKGCSC